MTGYHMAAAGWVRRFAEDANTKTARYYRFVNEVPAILMALIVILAVVRPF
jgi:putative membrane protein